MGRHVSSWVGISSLLALTSSAVHAFPGFSFVKAFLPVPYVPHLTLSKRREPQPLSKLCARRQSLLRDASSAIAPHPSGGTRIRDDDENDISLPDHNQLFRPSNLQATLDRICDANYPQETDDDSDSSPGPTLSVYSQLMHRIAASTSSEVEPGLAVDCAERLLRHLKERAVSSPDLEPTSVFYNLVIRTWSKSGRGVEASDRCQDLLQELWARHDNSTDPISAARFLPDQATYASTLVALARSGGGRPAAERAEALLEEMERSRVQHPSMGPTTRCINLVLDCWSKSGDHCSTQRCQTILGRMQSLSRRGRPELEPDAASFNAVLNALAQSNQRDAARRAEELLERMDAWSRNSTSDGRCRPDHLSFNIVLKCWSRSRDPRAAMRADAILRHMERRYADGETDVRPDVATYNTVLTAWARSADPDATERAERLLWHMVESAQGGNELARPNALSYNILLNVLAKSNQPGAASRAMEVLGLMKRLSAGEGREDCRPDIYSYTSVIDALAKASTGDSARSAERLLQEVEDLYETTEDVSLKPNVRLYTSVIHAIARSRTHPERAERIVQRLEARYLATGDTYIQPDVVCYDALLNAYGWASSATGRGRKCYDLYQRMLELYRSGANPNAKPDIITCNSVLNALAHEELDTELERAEAMRLVVDTFEMFQREAPRFGWPNHVTYATVLQAVASHLDPSDERRASLAESTFWQCCSAGHVSVAVVAQLHRALASEWWDRLEHLLGDALVSTEDAPLGFRWHKLPARWTRFAPPPHQRRNSRPSPKSRSPEVTKAAVAAARQSRAPWRRPTRR